MKKINGYEITKGLIIRSPHIENILGGYKNWEMRSRKTRIRGPVALKRSESIVTKIEICISPFDLIAKNAK